MTSGNDEFTGGKIKVREQHSNDNTLYWSNMSADIRATNDNEDVLLRYRLFIIVSNIEDSKSNTFKHISSDDRDKENTLRHYHINTIWLNTLRHQGRRK